jgi:hypothetical protein
VAHLMVVLSNAKPDREEEFNSWYSDVHVYDTINKLDGFQSAQRFVRADLDGAPPQPYRYLAIYEIDDGDLETAYAQFSWQRAERAEAIAAGRSPVVAVSDSIDPDVFLVGFFSSMTERIPSTRKDLLEGQA